VIRASRARAAQALLWIVPALWSSNYLIGRLAADRIAPHALAFGRWSLALALMLPFVWRDLVHPARPWRHEWRQMLVLGALGMWICGAWVYLGARQTTATNMALIYAATPVAIAVASVKLLHERMSRAQGVAVVSALAGVLFVIARGDPRVLLEVRLNPGDGWILAAAVAWTVYSVLLRRWPSVLPPAARLAAITSGGVLALLPFTLWEAWAAPGPPFGAAAAGLVVLAAVVPGVLSYTAYSVLQKELGAARAALVLYLAPLYAVVLAWLVLGERPAWYHAVGGTLILPSIWLASRR
jgi:drug/metabolite transporter (DMT)-like permease